HDSDTWRLVTSVWPSEIVDESDHAHYEDEQSHRHQDAHLLSGERGDRKPQCQAGHGQNSCGSRSHIEADEKATTQGHTGHSVAFATECQVRSVAITSATLTSVVERTEQFGVRRAFGAR